MLGTAEQAQIFAVWAKHSMEFDLRIASDVAVPEVDDFYLIKTKPGFIHKTEL